jgi:hypothetical protein
MTCPRCQAANRDGARFCRECGATFPAVCAACGAKVEADSKFCDSCGAPLAATPPQPAAAAPRFGPPESYTPKHLAEKILMSKSALEGERKQVTVLFADLKGSMELLADRDPEEARKLLDPVLERMMEAVHRYEGTVNQVMGDGIMALFGAPVAHEDHAVRACYAALDMQAAIRRAKVFARILKAAKLPHFRVYDLRHTYASLLLSAGAPLLYVSQQLGHKKPTTTLRYYAKWVPSGDRRWVDLLGRDLAQPETELEPETGTRTSEPAQVGYPGATGKMTKNAEGARGSAPLAPNGEPCRNRTYNLLIKSQLLYQLS